MKITRIEYEACFNLGNYENERIRYSAQVQPDEIIDSVVTRLRELARLNALPNMQKRWEERYSLETEIRNLERKLAKAQQQWATAADFLKAQGINTEPPSFPELINLLPEAAEESVVEGEYDDEDEDEDEDGI